MSSNVNILEPQSLWKNFSGINAVPRASKQEERIIEYMMAFGRQLNLETSKDEIGNVLIKKPASQGMEDRQTIVMQSHLDMVHQKNNDTVFDFDTEGIKMLVDGDWVKAEGTTLGADNGIGVATIMAILESTDIPHPPIEALFTIDEETGMTGALGLKGGLLTGTILLNLDTEDDNELTIGCAGGIDVTANGSYKMTNTASAMKAYRLKVKGCTGGHSGMDIHLGRANANKLMNRVLFELSRSADIRLIELDGGGLRNAIPRESVSIIAVEDKNLDALLLSLDSLKIQLKEEYQSTDPNITLEWSSIEDQNQHVDLEFQNKLIRSIYACPNGIYRMSPEISGLVQTSNNLARVLVKNGRYEIMCLSRSSVETEKSDIVNAISSSFELLGANVSCSGDYPGWRPNPDASIVKIMTELYQSQFDEEPHVNACHAGLECGILGTNYPEMDMISFGPNIRGAHSPDEKVQISSVQKFWSFLLNTLNNIPKKTQ